MISQDNIEIYLLDFSDGNLSPEEITELRSFVSMFPEWRADFDEAEMNQTVFTAKPLLKRSELDPSLSLAEEWTIAEMEGVLSDDEAQALHQWRDHSKQGKQLSQQFASTRFAPEEVTYSSKDRLKKSSVQVYILPAVKWAAASVVLLLALNQWVFNSSSSTIPGGPTDIKVAQTTETDTPTKPVVKENNSTSIVLPVEETSPSNALAVTVTESINNVAVREPEDNITPLHSKMGSIPVATMYKEAVLPNEMTLAVDLPKNIKRGLRISDLPIVGNLLAKNKVNLPEFKNINFSSTKDGQGKTDSWSLTFFAIHIDHDKRE